MKEYFTLRDKVADGLLAMSKLSEHYGMVGWVRSRNGLPDFIYGEITGYFLSFCSYQGCRTPERTADIKRIAASHVKWLGQVLEQEYATRVMLNNQSDWRNSAIFSFDTAMIIRGLSDVKNIVDTKDCIEGYRTRFNQFIDIPNGTLVPYIQVNKSLLPEKWSTRRDVHYMKTIANTISYYPGVLDPQGNSFWEMLIHKLLSIDDKQLLNSDGHPLMYYLEGCVLLSNNPTLGSNTRKQLLQKAVHVFKRIAEIIRYEGLNQVLFRNTEYRSDVLCQFARLGFSLMLIDQLDTSWFEFLKEILEYVINNFVIDGKVLFFDKNTSENYINAWSAMFLYQALDFVVLMGNSNNNSDNTKELPYKIY